MKNDNSITTDISDPLRKKISNTKIKFQKELCKLLVSEAPELKEIFEINRDLQIAFTRRADIRYEYLWKHDRGRLVTDGGISKWLNFGWTEEDEKALLNESQHYVKLHKHINDLENRNQGHPMWPEARQVFNEMQNEPPMRQINEQLNKVFKKVEEELKISSL